MEYYPQKLKLHKRSRAVFYTMPNASLRYFLNIFLSVRRREIGKLKVLFIVVSNEITYLKAFV